MISKEHLRLSCRTSPSGSKASVEDAFCACRQFRSSINASSESTLFCQDEVHMSRRWLSVLDPRNTNDENASREEWKRHGLVFRVYKYIGKDEEFFEGNDHKSLRSSGRTTITTYLVAFRHQEGNQWHDSDQWEAMGLWGRNAVHLLGGIAPSNSIVSFLARYIQWIIRSTRRYLFQWDYVTLSSDALMEDLQLISKNKNKNSNKNIVKFEFTGYSMGGALAQIQSIHHGGSPAIVFASNGMLDILHNYGLQKKEGEEKNLCILNIFEESDIIPKMDCQPRSGTICTFKQSLQKTSQQVESKSLTKSSLPPFHEDPHMNLIYGNGMIQSVFRQSNSSDFFLQRTNNMTDTSPTLSCRSGHEWNVKNNATCLSYSYERNKTNCIIWDLIWSGAMILLILIFLSSCINRRILKSNSKIKKQKRA